MQIIENIIGLPASDLEVVRATALEKDLAVWLVGGPVRDALLGREVHDLDFLVEHGFEEIAEAVAARLDGSVRLHRKFLTAKVFRTVGTGDRLHHGQDRDLSLSRFSPGCSPRDGIRGSAASRFFHQRDRPRSARLDSPRSGSGISGHRAETHPHSPSRTAYADDPTRILRALRLGARLGFEIESRTSVRLREALEANALSTVSPQRVWREIFICVQEPEPASAFGALLDHGVLQTWTGASSVHPELRSRLSRLSASADSHSPLDLEVLYLATLFEGLEDATMPRGLPFSRRRLALLESLLLGADSWSQSWSLAATDAERGRLCIQLGPEELIAASIRHQRPEEMLRPCRELRGTRLPFKAEELGLDPGPHIGKALQEARVEAWLRGDGSRKDLLEFARSTALRYLNERKP